MSDWIEIKKDPQHVARERAKAKELRKTQWWRQQLEKGICHYCGKKFAADKLTMDHVVPVARGGKSTKGNIVPACKECNSDKTFLTPAEIILRELEKENPSNGGC
ncbi:MAG: HNH endonuclease [Kiritimatiellales bacterium]|nr:HNH endonuclease [Kiritimatiellales bacterium]